LVDVEKAQLHADGATPLGSRKNTLSFFDKYVNPPDSEPKELLPKSPGPSYSVIGIVSLMISTLTAPAPFRICTKD
jgi:hypothetical protein